METRAKSFPGTAMVGDGIRRVVFLLLPFGIFLAQPSRAQDEQGEPSVSVSLTSDTAAPGENVRLTLLLQASVPLRAMTVALDFDESQLQLVLVEGLVGQSDQEAFLDDALVSAGFDNLDTDPGNQPYEGWVFLEIDFGVEPFIAVDSEVPTPIAAFEFHIRENAQSSFSPITFTSVGPVGTAGMERVMDNEVVAFEGAAPDGGEDSDSLLEDARLEGGVIKIIGEIGFFMRGDANFDHNRDIADPIFTLHHLFLSGKPLPCGDAGDANDDGEVNVSDPIFTLRRLFVEPGEFPAPQLWGRDPTPDGLSCPFYSSN